MTLLLQLGQAVLDRHRRRQADHLRRHLNLHVGSRAQTSLLLCFSSPPRLPFVLVLTEQQGLRDNNGQQ